MNRAIEDLTKFIGNNPSSAEAYYARGNVYYFLQEDDNAIHDYSKAIALDKDYANAYYGRAILYKISKKDDLALRDFDMYIELAGKNSDLYPEVERLINEIVSKD